MQKYWGRELEKTGLGLRISRTLFNIDFALSYFNGNSSLPVLRELSAVPPLAGTFYYPRQQVLGFDCAGEFKGIGFWGEGRAGYCPKTSAAGWWCRCIVRDKPVTVENSFRLLETSYWKYVLGLDYNFGSGFYANLQFLHGFFDEFAFTAAAQENLGLRPGHVFRRFGQLSFRPPGIQVGQRKDQAEGRRPAGNDRRAATAFALLPEAEFRVADALVMQAGGFWLVVRPKPMKPNSDCLKRIPWSFWA